MTDWWRLDYSHRETKPRVSQTYVVHAVSECARHLLALSARVHCCTAAARRSGNVDEEFRPESVALNLSWCPWVGERQLSEGQNGPTRGTAFGRADLQHKSNSIGRGASRPIERRDANWMSDQGAMFANGLVAANPVPGLVITAPLSLPTLITNWALVLLEAVFIARNAFWFEPA